MVARLAQDRLGYLAHRARLPSRLTLDAQVGLLTSLQGLGFN